MNANKSFVLILKGAVVILFISIAYLTTKNDPRCLRKENAMKEVINGRVTKVFVDSANHAYQMMEFTADGESRKTYVLVLEESGCFEYLQVGDSVAKESQSLQMNVFRGGEHISFGLSYECDSKDK